MVTGKIGAFNSGSSALGILMTVKAPITEMRRNTINVKG
jgi:hypothetical protein